MTTTKKTSSKKTTETRRKNESAKLLDAVSKLDSQAIVSEVGQLQASLQGTLAGVSATITTKLDQMKQVDEAIAVKEERLNELFDIEAEAATIESVREQREQEEADFESRREERDKVWSDEQSERTKRWQREQEEHEYMQSQRMKRSQEEFNAEVSERRRNETIRQQEMERQWNDRENSLKSQEKEVEELRKQVAEFDAKLKSEISKAEAIVGNRMKRDHEHEIQILKLDQVSNSKLFDAEKVSLNNTISSLSDQIEELQKRLEVTQQDAKEVVTSALQSASGRDAANTLQKALDSGALSNKK